MQLTPEQHRAIFDHGRNLAVVAGAGSGKTRVLVERYLALLDQHPDWPLNALVAITFTRKAAGEMRDRVRAALELRLRAASTEAEREVWAGRLAGMDSARINTIHSLCADILRANAAEAGLDPDFSVLEEAAAALLLDETIDAVLQAMVDARSPTLKLFTIYDALALRSTLVDLARADFPSLPADPFAVWSARWADSAVMLLAAARPALIAHRDWALPVLPPTDDKLYAIYSAVAEVLAIILDEGGDLSTRCEALAGLHGLIRLNVGSPKAWGDKDILAEAKDNLRGLRDLGDALVEQIGQSPGALDQDAAALLPLWAELAAAVRSAYDEAKAAAAALDFDDLEARTCALLTAHATVRARYQGDEFRHLLVDEFQDTNAAQWEIVRLLAPPDQPGRLFVVGDPKQSIYAFRGADVSVFGGVRRLLTDHSGAEAEVALAQSFRTHRPLVDCFNALFAHILDYDPASPTAAYEVDLGEPMHAHRVEPPADRPALMVRLVDHTMRPDDADPDFMRRWEALEIARQIHALVAEGLPIYDRALDAIRPVGYGDFALLFQSTTHLMLYEEVFKALELPFVTIAGRGYYSRQEVWDLLNLLRALYNPADDLALAAALRSPLFGFSDDALLALRLVRDESGACPPLWDALEQADSAPLDERALVRFACEALHALRALAGRVTISELLRAALSATGYLAILTGLPDGDRRRGNVEKLLRLAEASGRITLSAFTQYLNDLSAREVREGEADLEVAGAVQLMTVHASKGLEFPVVILVDTSWDRRARDGGLVVIDPQEGAACKIYDAVEEQYVKPYAYQRALLRRDQREKAERKRLLYVAATRAQDYLIVSGGLKQRKDGRVQGDWLGWLLDALTVDDLRGAAGVNTRPWGQFDLQVIATPPDDVSNARLTRPAAWDSLDSAAVAPADPPPLLAPVAIDRTAVARHLSVTQIDGMGGNDRSFRGRFRRGVLHDAPATIGPALRDRRAGRLIGEIVHEVLRWWNPREEVDLDELLKSYTWEQGIVDPVEQNEAINEARQLIRRFLRSDVCQWLREARATYQELPFILRTEKRIIHGILDLLIAHPDGSWAVVDYKTSAVPHAGQGLAAFEAHAQRYRVQVGAYAEAVSRQLSLTGQVDASALRVYIHYVRYSQTIELPRQVCQDALSRLETYIGELIE